MTGRGPSGGRHQCPVARCPAGVAPDRLMCRFHWYLVPRTLRDAVWRTWNSGEDAGTEGHRLACSAAVLAVNARQEATP